MAAIDFPNTPQVNDTFTAGVITWKWDGTTWKSQGIQIQGPEGPQGDTGPAGEAGADGADGAPGADGSDAESDFDTFLMMGA
jgi:hypothetical protein